jgi:hypothetical protein
VLDAGTGEAASVSAEDPLTKGHSPAAASDDDPRVRRRTRIWGAGLVLLSAGTLALLFTHIQRTVPYPYHADEGFISGPALKVLVAGTLHPHRFNYPSLPTYLAAGAMTLGFFQGAANREIRDVKQIGRVGYPYYETPRIMKTARQAFALLAVIAVAMTGVSSWIAFRKPSTLVLAPLLLAASPLFFRQAWTYLNVDIVGTCFVMLALTACLIGTVRPSIRQSAVLPGMFAGFAMASKYSLAIVILPVLIAIALYGRRGRIVWACLAALGAMIASFLIAAPYSLVDIPGFLNGVGYEIFHYASGHAGAAGDPGLPQLLYYLRHLLSEFGYGAATAAIAGIALYTRLDWRRALVVGAFPVGLLWLLSSQRVHFTRNAVPIHPFVAMFAAYGVVAVHWWIVDMAEHRGWALRKPAVPVLAAIVLTGAAVPFWFVADHLRNRTDSRNLARAWVAENLPYDWAIVVPTELGFDRRGLEIRGRTVKAIDMKSARDQAALDAMLADVPSPAAIMVPRWGADRRSPGMQRAETLNALTPRWRTVARFGSNDVLVNYLWPTAWGDPAFSIAVLR